MDQNVINVCVLSSRPMVVRITGAMFRRILVHNGMSPDIYAWSVLACLSCGRLIFTLFEFDNCPFHYIVLRKFVRSASISLQLHIILIHSGDCTYLSFTRTMIHLFINHQRYSRPKHDFTPRVEDIVLRVFQFHCNVTLFSVCLRLRPTLGLLLRIWGSGIFL